MSWRVFAICFLMTLAVIGFVVSDAMLAEHAEGPMRLMAPGLHDGAFLSPRNAATGCGGRNVSPALTWSPPPGGAESFAVTMYDPDGAKGLGSVHWVAYGIGPDTRGLDENAGSAPAGRFVGGKTGRGTIGYAGPCPPAGDQPHHYVIGVYALALKPDALAPGLTRDAFLQAIENHVVAASSLVLLYAR